MPDSGDMHGNGSFGRKLQERARVEIERMETRKDFVRDVLGMDATEPLSEEYREQSRQYIREFIKRSRIGPKRLARRAGVPGGDSKNARTL